MGIKELLLQENEHEGQSSKKMIERCKQADPDWRPHEKSMTTFALAKHIVRLHMIVSALLKGDSFNFAKAKRLESTTFDELSSALNKGLEDNADLIKNSDEATWSKIFTLKAGDHIIIEAPKVVIARMIIFNHLIHHRGQLSVYLRLQNISVPGMYGPSADEK